MSTTPADDSPGTHLDTGSPRPPSPTPPGGPSRSPKPRRRRRQGAAALLDGGRLRRLLRPDPEITRIEAERCGATTPIALDLDRSVSDGYGMLGVIPTEAA